MEEVIAFLVSYVLFPGLLFAGVVGLLLDGIDRKIAAHAQHRIGPPVWQTFLDVGKLMGKEDITPESAQKWMFNLAPLLAVGGAVTAMMLIPVNGMQPAFATVADLIVLIYLLNIPAIAIILGGYASGSPFGSVGSSRYVMMIVGYEFAFIVAILTVAAHVGTLTWVAPPGSAPTVFGILEYQARNGWLIAQLPFAAVAMLLVLPGKLLRVPFDIPEAHTEIVAGPLTEYSGPKLALFKLAHVIETFAIAALFSSLFLGGSLPITGFQFWVAGIELSGVAMLLLKCLVVVLFLTLVRASVARFRVDQALRFYWIVVAVLALLNLAVVLSYNAGVL